MDGLIIAGLCCLAAFVVLFFVDRVFHRPRRRYAIKTCRLDGVPFLKWTDDDRRCVDRAIKDFDSMK